MTLNHALSIIEAKTYNFFDFLLLIMFLIFTQVDNSFVSFSVQLLPSQVHKARVVQNFGSLFVQLINYLTIWTHCH